MLNKELNFISYLNSLLVRVPGLFIMIHDDTNGRSYRMAIKSAYIDNTMLEMTDEFRQTIRVKGKLMVPDYDLVFNNNTGRIFWFNKKKETL
jgi:hypothetical protein